jgi:tetratricopeptide (TPR) repeat protein
VHGCLSSRVKSAVSRTSRLASRLPLTVRVAAWCRVALIAGMIVLGPVTARAIDSGADRELAAAREALESAEVSFDPAALLKAREQIDRLVEQPHAPPRAAYLQGRAYLDLVTWNQRHGSSSEALHYAQLAITAGQAAVERNRQHSDSHRVLGEAYSRVIGLRRGITGLLYGQRSQQQLSLALRLDPLNARAHLAMGIAKLRSPRLVGGDGDAALHAFEKAIALAPQNWEPHAWLGVAYRERGDVVAARTALERALDLSPRNEWVKAELDALRPAR